MMTITEAMAEIKLLNKKIENKKEFVLRYLARQNTIVDPLKKDGGSANAIRDAVKSINDMEKNVVSLRLAIHDSNMKVTLNIKGISQTVQGWLTWRREIQTPRRRFVGQLLAHIEDVRKQAAAKGLAMVEADGATVNPEDVIVNISEKAAHDEKERIDDIMATLDGQLSQLNATTQVSV